jgi:hypothetical protein
MKILTKAEVAASCDGGELEFDNHGQMVIYTGVYLWKDGSYRDEPDPLVIKEDINS